MSRDKLNIKLVVVKDPLNCKAKDISLVDYRPGETALALKERLFPKADLSLAINGVPVPREKLHLTCPTNGDEVLVMAEFQGGDGASSSILRIIALIAVAVIAPQIAIGLEGLLGGVSFMQTIFGATMGWYMTVGLITMATGALVNSLLAPPKPKLPALGNDYDMSQAYGWSPQTIQTPGAVKPKAYGINRHYGNIINAYTSSDPSGEVVLNALIDLGSGPRYRLFDFRIDDQPITDYKGITVDVNLGEMYQKPLSGFNDTKVEEAVGVEVKHSDQPNGIQRLTNVDNFDALEVVLGFNGLFCIDMGSGDKYANTVKVRISVKKELTGSWKVITHSCPTTWVPGYWGGEGLTWFDGYYTGASLKTYKRWSRGRWIYDTVYADEYSQVWYEDPAWTAKCDPTDTANYDETCDDPGAHRNGEPVLDSEKYMDWQWMWFGDDDAEGNPVQIYSVNPGVTIDDFVQITENTQKTFRRVYRVPFLETGHKYYIKVEKLSLDKDPALGDAVIFQTIRVVYRDNFQYPMDTTVAVSAAASAKLSGTLKFSCLGRDAIVNVYNGANLVPKWSNNPADVMADVLTQPVFIPDVVTHNGKYYICKLRSFVSSSLTEPGIGANWQSAWELWDIPGTLPTCKYEPWGDNDLTPSAYVNGKTYKRYRVQRYDGVGSSRIDWVKFKELADYCNELVPNGKQKPGLSFDGNDRVSFSPGTIAAGVVSFLARFKTGTIGSLETVASQGRINTNGFALRINANGTFSIGAHGGGVITSDTVLESDTWYTVWGVLRDAGKGKIFLFDSIEKTGTAPYVSSSDAILLGVDKDAGGAYVNYFTGILDVFRIYEREITLVNVEDFMEELPVAPRNLVMDVDFTEVDGAGKIVDKSSVGRLGTITGATFGLGYNLEKRMTFNGLFDSAGTLWEAALQIGQICDATPYWVGGVITLAIEKPVDLTAANRQLFTVGSTGIDSFEEEFLPMENRASLIEVKFANRYKGHKPDAITVPDDLGTRNNNSISLPLFGVTKPSEAFRLGKRRIYRNKYLIRSVSLNVVARALSSTIGDVVDVSNPVPSWGVADGKLIAATSTTISVDKDVTFAVGQGYEALIQLANDTLLTKVLVNPATTEPVTVLAGNPITVQQSFSVVPEKYDDYSIGFTDIAAKPFRLIQLHNAKDMNFKLALLEYNGTTFNADLLTPAHATPNYSSFRPLQGVTDLALVETLVKEPDGKIRDYIDISFNPPENPAWLKAEVWYRIIGETGWKNHGDCSSGLYRMPCKPVKEYFIAIVSVNTLGAKMDISRSPKKSIQTLGKTAPPADVTNFAYTITGRFIHLTWDANTDIDLRGYNIKVDGVYKVKKLSGNTFRLKGSDLPVGAHTIQIWALDTTGHESTNPATINLTVSLAAVQNLTVTVVENSVEIDWTPGTHTFPIDFYNIYRGNTYATKTIICEAARSRKRIRETAGAIYKYWIEPVDIAGNVAVEASVASVTLSQSVNPPSANMGSEYIGEDVRLYWDAPASTFPIRRYELTFSHNASVRRTKEIEYIRRVNWTGSTNVTIKTEDILGNLSNASAPIAIADIAPGEVTGLTGAASVRNVAVLDWGEPTSSLPISCYEIYRAAQGGSFASAVLVCKVTASRKNISESSTTDVTYRYYVRAVDTAGNKITTPASYVEVALKGVNVYSSDITFDTQAASIVTPDDAGVMQRVRITADGVFYPESV